MSENNLPISYHTFLFPFLWKDDKKVKTSKDFIKCLKIVKNECWVEENVNSSDFAKDNFAEKYNQYHYFNPAARNAIYSNFKDDNEVVQNYKYSLPCDSGWVNSPKGQDNKAKYVIETKEKKVKEKKDENCTTTYQFKKYELLLNGIRLKLFNTGIGILIFEAENYSYPTLETINKINDFGRRIYMPFSDEKNECDACAERIYITYNDKDVFDAPKEDYDLQKPEFFNTTKIAPLIKKLLTNDEYSITTNEKEKSRKTFYIEPVIDDRMFVACYYINPDLANEMQVWENDDYAYINHIKNSPITVDDCKITEKQNMAKELYKFVYVDSGEAPTCKSKNLLTEMLGKKHIYDRWIEEGSLTGVTEYSLVTITSKEWEFLANNFLTEYIEMLILTLAQRATLLNFERLLSDSAKNKNDIRRIHRAYLKFQSQLLLQEVTPQQQGIELYRMMLDNLFVNEQIAEIENQIEDVFAQKTADNEAIENKIFSIIAIIGVIELFGKIMEWFNAERFCLLCNGADISEFSDVCVKCSDNLKNVPEILQKLVLCFNHITTAVTFGIAIVVMFVIVFYLHKKNK